MQLRIGAHSGHPGSTPTPQVRRNSAELTRTTQNCIGPAWPCPFPRAPSRRSRAELQPARGLETLLLIHHFLDRVLASTPALLCPALPS